jgi:hypothetical protein
LENGNVGIGTDAPQAKLEVIGSVSATTFIGNLACPAGWTSLNSGRLCYDPTLRTGVGHTAIAVCSGLKARVCTHTDMQQLCGLGGGFNPYQDTAPGWYGDHALATGGDTDDEFLTWNYTYCNANNDGPAVHAPHASYNYFCCL